MGLCNPDEVELEYSTWGSWGQYARTLAVLKNGKVVDPMELKDRVWKGSEKEVKIDGVTVRLIDRSSRKNRYVHICVPRSEVVAVLSDVQTSGGWKGFRLEEGTGEIKAEEAVKEEIAGNKKYITRQRIWYFLSGPLKVELEREKPEREMKFVGKPRVTIKYEKYEIPHIYAWGDTYHVKEELKKLGFTWDPLYKMWMLSPVRKEDVERVARALSEHVTVTVKGVSEEPITYG